MNNKNEIELERIAQDLENGKIAPEFGNKDHIDALRHMDRKKEEQENLTTYVVDMEIWCTASVKVDANNEDEASDRAKEEFDLNDVDDIEFDLMNVKKKAEKESNENFSKGQLKIQ